MEHATADRRHADEGRLGPCPEHVVAVLGDLGLDDEEMARYFRIDLTMISRLRRMLAHRATSGRADGIDTRTPVSEVARRMGRDGVRAMPVRRGNHVVGVITDRDIALRIVADGRDPLTTTAGQVMTASLTHGRTGGGAPS